MNRLNKSPQEWWVAQLDLPSDLFRADFVVMEAAGARVDNNAAKDFSLPLAGKLAFRRSLQRVECATKSTKRAALQIGLLQSVDVRHMRRMLPSRNLQMALSHPQRLAS